MVEQISYFSLNGLAFTAGNDPVVQDNIPHLQGAIDFFKKHEAYEAAIYNEQNKTVYLSNFGGRTVTAASTCTLLVRGHLWSDIHYYYLPHLAFKSGDDRIVIHGIPDLIESGKAFKGNNEKDRSYDSAIYNAQNKTVYIGPIAGRTVVSDAATKDDYLWLAGHPH